MSPIIYTIIYYTEELLMTTLTLMICYQGWNSCTHQGEVVNYGKGIRWWKV